MDVADIVAVIAGASLAVTVIVLLVRGSYQLGKLVDNQEQRIDNLVAKFDALETKFDARLDSDRRPQRDGYSNPANQQNPGRVGEPHPRRRWANRLHHPAVTKEGWRAIVGAHIA